MATVQVVIYVSSLAIFGPAPVSRSSKEHSDQIGMPNLIVENVFRHEPGVLLVGNRDADLIRLGARYSPCMRHDPDLYRSIVEKQNELDRS